MEVFNIIPSGKLAGFIFAFGLLMFIFSLFVFVMGLFGKYEGVLFLGSIFGMLNASIAIGVSEILSIVKQKDRDKNS